MRIGELAQKAGVSTKTIRFYEDAGVLPAPARESNGYRSYLPEAAERLRFVRESQSAGLSLEQISHILELRDQGQATCHHTIELLESHLKDVDDQIEEMRRTHARLTEMIHRARSLDPTTCNDPNRCQTISIT